MPETQALIRRSATALLWSYAGAFTRAAAQLIIQVLLARLLGPQAFGQAMLIMIVLGFGWLLADAGFGAALIQRPELTEADVSYALGWVLAVSITIGALIVVAAPQLSEAFGEPALAPMLRLCGALIPLQALSNLPMSLLRRRLDMKRQQLIQVGSYVLGYGGVGALLALLGFGAWSLVIGFGAQTLIVLVAGYWVVRHTLRPTLRGDGALRAFGFSVMGTNLANWAIDNLDRVVVGRFWGAGALGAYSAAGNLARAPVSLLVNAAQSVVFSTASLVQRDSQRLGRGFLGALNMVSLLTFPLFCFLGLHAQVVIHALYGERWQQSAPLFAAFCVAVPFYAVLAISGPVLWAVGSASSELKVQLAVAVALVVGLVLLANLPLERTVWLVPALYAVRALLVMSALARRVELPARRIGAAALGGLLLAVVVAAVTEATKLWVASPSVQAACAAAAGLLLCLVAIRVGDTLMLCAELRQAVQSRAASSLAARRLCALLGLPVVAP